MARYIDADKAMEEINRIGGHNLCEWETLGVKALIDRQPTADVVPKSEVEKLKIEIEALKIANEKMYAANKAQAREIFEEIEKEIDLNMSVIQKILNAKGGRANGKTVLISKYDVFIEAKKHLAELKKKYSG